MIRLGGQRASLRVRGADTDPGVLAQITGQGLEQLVDLVDELLTSRPQRGQLALVLDEGLARGGQILGALRDPLLHIGRGRQLGGQGCGLGRELVTDPDLCRRIEVVRDDTGVARRRQPDDLGAGGVEAGAQLLAPSARELV